MRFRALDDYLSSLPRAPGRGDEAGRVWLDGRGCVQGRYFNSTLTSAFQPIRDTGENRILAYEGFVRSYNPFDKGLSLWRLLDFAASDGESVELDRLCRMLHAINFFRQRESSDMDLFVSVHARLLTAVEADHGAAFRRVLGALELPYRRMVLQLPAVSAEQGWPLKFVSENYRRHGFRLALAAQGISQAYGLLDSVNPDFIKLDACEAAKPDAGGLLREAYKRGIAIIFKRVENPASLQKLRALAEETSMPSMAQGFLWGLPQADLAPGNSRFIEAAQSVLPGGY